MNTISGLKPIIDMLYNDMNDFKEKSDKRIKELEAEVLRLTEINKRLKTVPIVVDSDSEDDEAFAEAALAPPASSLSSVLAQVENKKEDNVNTTTTKEDVKSVKMIGGKDAKEYMKEYQRTYRKKQKENTINKTNT
jgi:hypothetical protein